MKRELTWFGGLYLAIASWNYGHEHPGFFAGIVAFLTFLVAISILRSQGPVQ